MSAVVMCYNGIVYCTLYVHVLQHGFHLVRVLSQCVLQMQTQMQTQENRA